MKKTEISVEIVKYEKDYEDFNAFNSECEEKIYRKMIDVYEELKKSNEKEKKLIFVAKINGIIFDTNFVISKSHLMTLKEVILPFFESVEDYETCDKILNLCSD